MQGALTGVSVRILSTPSDVLSEQTACRKFPLSYYLRQKKSKQNKRFTYFVALHSNYFVEYVFFFAFSYNVSSGPIVG